MIKKFVKLALAIFSLIMIIIIAMIIYFYLKKYYIPKLKLCSIVDKFEKASRNRDRKRLLKLYSKESKVYKLIKYKQKSMNIMSLHAKIFNKYYEGFKCGNAQLHECNICLKVFNKKKYRIGGSCWLKAKKDDNYIEIKIRLNYEDNQWKILQIKFPDHYLGK